MFRTASQALAAATLIFAANTHAVVINFDTDAAGGTLSAGDVITNQYSAFGATFSTDAITNTDSLAPSNLMIFDSANPTGGDPDLATPGTGTGNTTALGNILIISEDNDANDPDDNAEGGNIFIDFDFDVYFNQISFLDIEESSSTVTLYDVSGTQLGSVFNITGLGDNSFETIQTKTNSVRSAKIYLSGSGAITGLNYRAAADVPEPTTAMLMGLGLLSIVSLRKKARAA